jgi:hypothetical protein
MEFSPRRSLCHRKLYRKLMFAVIFATFAAIFAASTHLPNAWLVAQITPQYGHKAASVKGPRALGIIELSPNGKKGRVVPVAIMMDGKFYDAGSYKATPVPMALDFGIIYEGFRAGVSQGIFTITQPGQMNHVWIAEGTWLPAGERDPERSKKYSTPVIEDESKEGPPVLHRRKSADSDSDSDSRNKEKEKGKDDKASDKDKEPQKPATAAASPSATPPAGAPTPPPDTAKASSTPETVKAPPPEPDEPIADPNRPRLRRGKPDATSLREPYATFEPLTAPTPGSSSATNSATAKTGAAATGSAAVMPQITLIPAISDSGGPDPRPYTYDVKPAEEAIYRNKMIDLATTLVGAQASAAAKAATSATNQASAGNSSRSAGRHASKPSKPDFEDVNLRIFDLSNSNQPVLVFSAKIHPPAANATGSVADPKEITLIARTNLEGELQKLFFSQTDSQHLYSAPRMELIDAIDVDGDGRGELLFRRTFDSGSAYAVYRVTADQLWPLFEGTP